VLLAGPPLAPLLDRGGSVKRRAGHRRGVALDHESAARWISPKAPLKYEAMRAADERESEAVVDRKRR
jgi:hypothetical protein